MFISLGVRELIIFGFVVVGIIVLIKLVRR
jgi:hypothetical protein